MRLIDSVIRRSLSEAVEKSGGLLAFSRRIGVAHSTVLFWLTGKTKRINSDLWRGRVYPELESYLISHLPGMDLGCLREKYSDTLDGVFAERRMIPVPVVREADMMKYDSVMEPIGVFAEKFAFEKGCFICDSRKKYFAVELARCDGIFPDSWRLLLLCSAEERVKNADFAVLRLRGADQLLVRHVFLKNESIYLEALDGDCGNMTWNYRTDRGRIEWMFPALWMKAVCSGTRER